MEHHAYAILGRWVIGSRGRGANANPRPLDNPLRITNRPEDPPTRGPNDPRTQRPEDPTTPNRSLFRNPGACTPGTCAAKASRPRRETRIRRASAGGTADTPASPWEQTGARAFRFGRPPGCPV